MKSVIAALLVVVVSSAIVFAQKPGGRGPGGGGGAGGRGPGGPGGPGALGGPGGQRPPMGPMGERPPMRGGERGLAPEALAAGEAALRDQIMGACDANGDGQLNRAEREAAIVAIRDREALALRGVEPVLTQEDVVAMFDGDASGDLNAGELNAACQALDHVLGKGAHERVAPAQGQAQGGGFGGGPKGPMGQGGPPQGPMGAGGFGGAVIGGPRGGGGGGAKPQGGGGPRGR